MFSCICWAFMLLVVMLINSQHVHLVFMNIYIWPGQGDGWVGVGWGGGGIIMPYLNLIQMAYKMGFIDACE